MRKGEHGTVTIDFHFVENRSRIFDFLSISNGPCCQCKPRTHGLLLFRMDVVWFADIDGHGHGSLWHLLPGIQLSFADFRGHTIVWSDLDKEKREIAFAPGRAP